MSSSYQSPSSSSSSSTPSIPSEIRQLARENLRTNVYGYIDELRSETKAMLKREVDTTVRDQVNSFLGGFMCTRLSELVDHAFVKIYNRLSVDNERIVAGIFARREARNEPIVTNAGGDHQLVPIAATAAAAVINGQQQGQPLQQQPYSQTNGNHTYPNQNIPIQNQNQSQVQSQVQSQMQGQMQGNVQSQMQGHVQSPFQSPIQVYPTASVPSGAPNVTLPSNSNTSLPNGTLSSDGTIPMYVCTACNQAGRNRTVALLHVLEKHFGIIPPAATEANYIQASNLIVIESMSQAKVLAVARSQHQANAATQQQQQQQQQQQVQVQFTQQQTQPFQQQFQQAAQPQMVSQASQPPPFQQATQPQPQAMPRITANSAVRLKALIQQKQQLQVQQQQVAQSEQQTLANGQQMTSTALILLQNQVQTVFPANQQNLHQQPQRRSISRRQSQTKELPGTQQQQPMMATTPVSLSSVSVPQIQPQPIISLMSPRNPMATPPYSAVSSSSVSTSPSEIGNSSSSSHRMGSPIAARSPNLIAQLNSIPRVAQVGTSVLASVEQQSSSTRPAPPSYGQATSHPQAIVSQVNTPPSVSQTPVPPPSSPWQQPSTLESLLLGQACADQSAGNSTQSIEQHPQVEAIDISNEQQAAVTFSVVNEPPLVELIREEEQQADNSSPSMIIIEQWQPPADAVPEIVSNGSPIIQEIPIEEVADNIVENEPLATEAEPAQQQQEAEILENPTDEEKPPPQAPLCDCLNVFECVHCELRLMQGDDEEIQLVGFVGVVSNQPGNESATPAIAAPGNESSPPAIAGPSTSGSSSEDVKPIFEPISDAEQTTENVVEARAGLENQMVNGVAHVESTTENIVVAEAVAEPQQVNGEPVQVVAEPSQAVVEPLQAVVQPASSSQMVQQPVAPNSTSTANNSTPSSSSTSSTLHTTPSQPGASKRSHSVSSATNGPNASASAPGAAAASTTAYFQFVRLKCASSSCSRMFKKSQWEDLKAHQERAHQIRYYQCRVKGCGQSFKTGSEQTAHCKRDHQANTLSKQWPCSACDNIFDSYTRLAGHVRYEHEHGEFKCTADGCLYTGAIVRQVKAHYFSAHGEVPVIPAKPANSGFSAEKANKRAKQ